MKLLRNLLSPFLAASLLASSLAASEVPFSSETTIEDPLDFARSLASADFDRDGDLDLVAVANNDDDVAWWENTVGDGSAWSRHDLNVDFADVQDVAVGDLDGDGDLDVIAAASGDHEILWWENDLGSGSACGADFCEHTVAILEGAYAVRVSDLDRDGDLDVVAVSRQKDLVRWYANGGNGSSWTEVTIDSGFDGAQGLWVDDLDGDGDPDVLGGAFNGGGEFAWWENDLGDGTSCGTDWCAHSLDSGSTNAVAAGDLDGDGDLDLLRSEPDGLTWWENDLGDGSSWVESPLLVAEQAFFGLAPVDVDGDGDLDIVGLVNGAWLENVAGDASSWTERSSTTAGDYWDVEVADLDGDGDLDFAGVHAGGDQLVWRRNETLHRSAAFPFSLPTGTIYAAQSLLPADLDGDGDLDLVVSGDTGAGLHWLENDGDPTDGGWTDHDLALGMASTFSAAAHDLDGDGDLDLALTAYDEGEVLWLENDGSPADGGWVLRVVDDTVVEPLPVAVGDLDGDGAPDLVSTSYDSGNDKIFWYENGSHPGIPTWTRHLVGIADAPFDFEIGDFDGDGDADLAATAGNGDAVYWYENDGDPADGAWTRHTVYENWDATVIMDGCDVDADGDLDLVVTAFNDNDVGWLENDGTPADGTWTRHLLVGNLGQAIGVACADLDGDGDMDVATTGYANGVVRTYLSDGTPADGGWEAIEVATGLSAVFVLEVADLDRDGREDVVATVAGTGEVSWWRNLGGQFALPTTDEVVSPTPVEGSEDVLLLRIDGAHRGRAGDDDAEIAAFELLFDDGADPLSGSELDALVEVLRLHLDDGDGVFEPDFDTDVLEAFSPFNLTGGVLTLPMLDGDPGVQLAVGATSAFWVSVDLTADATSAVPDIFRTTHLTGITATGASPGDPSSSGEMASTDLPLVLEGQIAVSASINVDDPIALLPIPDQEVGTGVNFTLDLGSFVDDPDSSVLTYDLTGMPDWLSLSAEGVLAGRPKLADITASPLEITVTVTDAAGGFDSGSFQLSVVELTETIVVDGSCTLGDAILAAESNAAVGGCVSVGGIPTIVLDADVVLMEADEVHSTLRSSTHAGLPDVTVEMTIQAGQASGIRRSDTLGCDATGADHFRLLNLESGGRLTLDGVTLENGCARLGGAVYVDQASLTLTGSRFLGNRAQGLAGGNTNALGGAVMLGNGGRLESVTDCVFEGNRAASHAGGGARGGALHVASNAELVGPVTGSELVANEAMSSTSGGVAEGGAISVFCNCELDVTDTTFSSNRATGGDTTTSTGGDATGGSVRVADGPATFERVVFADSEARGGSSSTNRAGSARGGTVKGATLTLRDVEIRGSLGAGGDGAEGGLVGGGALEATDVVLERVTILGAEAVAGDGDDNVGGLAKGGAISISNGGTLDARHLTVSGASARGGSGVGDSGGGAFGGALHLDELGSGMLHHLTVIGSEAVSGTGSPDGSAGGGGLYAVAGTVAMSSSILAGSTVASGLGAPTAQDCSRFVVFTSAGYNVVEAPGDCSFAATGDQTGVDPLLDDPTELGCAAPLSDGSCISVRPLASGSPALDAASCAVSGATVDARGFARPFDVTGVPDAGDGCDAGAYEFHESDAWADVGVTKSDGMDMAVPGGGVTYTVVASNAGPAAATGVELVDTLPPALACTWSSVASDGATGNSATGSGDLDEALTLPAGSSVAYAVVCTVAPDATGLLVNTATISADQVDDHAANDAATDTDVLAPSTDLELELAADRTEVAPESEVTLSVRVANDGPSTSTGGTVTGSLPAGLSFSASPDCTHDAGTILCTVAGLAPGAETTLTVTALVDAGLPDGTTLSVEAAVVAQESDPDGSNDAGSVSLVVSPPLFTDGFESGDTSGWSSVVE